MGQVICRSSVIAPQPTTAASRCDLMLVRRCCLPYALVEAVYTQAGVHIPAQPQLPCLSVTIANELLFKVYGHQTAEIQVQRAAVSLLSPLAALSSVMTDSCSYQAANWCSALCLLCILG